MPENKPDSADYDAHAEDRVLMHHVAVEANVPQSSAVAVVKALAKLTRDTAPAAPLPLHRTEAGYPNCSTCDGGGCLDCTDPA